MSFFSCFQTGPFNLISPLLTTYNQQLWLTCVMQAEHSNSKNTEWATVIYTVILFSKHTCLWLTTTYFHRCLCQWETSSSLLRSTFSWREWCRTPAWCASTTRARSHERYTAGVWVSIRNQQRSLLMCSTVQLLTEPTVIQHFFRLSLQKCDEIIVLHLGYLNYTQYQVVVSFKGLENITYEIKVKFVVSDKLPDMCLFVAALDSFVFLHSPPFCSPQWKTYNPTFSQVEIWFRFVFVVLTFMVTVRARITFLSLNLNECQSVLTKTWQWTEDKLDKLTVFSLHAAVFVCTLAEKVLHEGLGHRTEVDVYPSPFAAALQRWASG